jgi:hypothetical protein
MYHHHNDAKVFHHLVQRRLFWSSIIYISMGIRLSGIQWAVFKHILQWGRSIHEETNKE